MAKSSYKKKKSVDEQAKQVQHAMNLLKHQSVLSYSEIVQSNSMVNVEDKFLYNAF